MKSIENTDDYKYGVILAKEYIHTYNANYYVVTNWIKTLETQNNTDFKINRQARIDYYKRYLLTQLITRE